MKFLKKLIEFFRKTKATAANIDLKLQAYIKKHSKQIKLLMTIFEAIFPEGAGIAKMTCLVTTVCYALGLDEITPQIAEYVKNELQKLYDKFKEELNKDDN